MIARSSEKPEKELEEFQRMLFAPSQESSGEERPGFTAEDEMRLFEEAQSSMKGT